MKNRIIDNGVFLPVIREIIEEGNDVSLTVSGNSMLPFVISMRDKVVLSPIKQPLKKGDIAFFVRDDGKFVLHRIVKVKAQNGYYFAGDSQNYIEGPIARENIFAIVTAICRKGKWIKPGSFFWFFFKHIWIYTIPIRPTLLAVIIAIRKFLLCLRREK